MAIHSSTIAWKIMDRGAWKATVHGIAKSWTRLNNFTFTSRTTPACAAYHFCFAAGIQLPRPRIPKYVIILGEVKVYATILPKSFRALVGSNEQKSQLRLM